MAAPSPSIGQRQWCGCSPTMFIGAAAASAGKSFMPGATGMADAAPELFVGDWRGVRHPSYSGIFATRGTLFRRWRGVRALLRAAFRTAFGTLNPSLNHLP